MRGGKREGSGRKRGALNSMSMEAREKAAAEGITPLEVMLTSMREAWDVAQTTEDPKLKIEAQAAAVQVAQVAAPYVHPRLAATEVKVDGDLTNRVVSGEPLTAEQWAKQYSSGVGTAAGAAEGTN